MPLRNTPSYRSTLASTGRKGLGYLALRSTSQRVTLNPIAGNLVDKRNGALVKGRSPTPRVQEGELFTLKDDLLHEALLRFMATLCTNRNARSGSASVVLHLSTVSPPAGA